MCISDATGDITLLAYINKLPYEQRTAVKEPTFQMFGSKNKGGTMAEPIMPKIIIYGWIAIVAFALLRDFVKSLTTFQGKAKPPEKLDITNQPQTEENKAQNINEIQSISPARKKPAIIKPLAVHEGLLLVSGFARNRGIESYRLEIQGDGMGVSHEIWGIDLKRALEVSGVKIGDRIRATLVGHVETSSIEGVASSTKMIWDVTKID